MLFTDVQVHDMFIAHNSVWIKISNTAAKSIGPEHAGICNFTISGHQDDANVERVRPLDMNKVGDLLHAAYMKYE